METRARFRVLTVGVLLMWVISFAVSAVLLIPRVDVRIITPNPEQLRLIAALVSLTLFALSSATLLLVRGLAREERRASRLERQLQKGAAAFEKSRSTLDTLLGHADFTILIFNSFGEVIYVNPAHERILGYSPQEYHDEPQLGDRIVISEDRQKRADYFSRISRMDIPSETVTIRYDSRAGNLVYLDYTASPILSSTGTTIGVLLIGHDATERKRVAEELKESEERFRAISVSAQDAIIMMDHNGIISYWNPAASAVFGYTSEEAVGQEMHLLLMLQRYYEAYLSGFATFKETGSGPAVGNTLEFEAVRKDGTEFPIELSLSAIRLKDKWNAVGIVRDIAERKQLQEQFLQAQKMEAIGQLAGGIAHDFNNLLTVMLGYSEMLLHNLEDERLKNHVEAISNAAEKAERLTSQILAFSRKQVREPRVLNINETVTEMEEMLRRVIGEDIELVTVLDKDLSHVRIDPGQIEQVIMNLAVNARDAMPDGGKLVIETANVQLDAEYANAHLSVQPGDFVMLAVTDTGQGMDKETQKRVFEPFFTTKEVGAGTGLGLSTVYGIVKQNNGNIWVYSEPGKGTTFKVYLPVVKEERAAAPAKEKAPEIPAGSETILLVEDEEVVRELAQQVLEQNGYNVVTARHGSEALIVAEQYDSPIHLLLTDVVMPEMSGKELAERLLALHSDLQVMYMSGYADAAIFQNGNVPETASFLQKPFTPVSLLRKVREVLDEQD